MNTENSTNNLDSADVTAALNGILTTDKFSASPQMSAFLKYVVEQTLMGNTRRIKAFTVGIEALGKSSSFDPQTDPSVRVLAKRLRSSLDTYYDQNPNTTVFIEMKPGSYIPRFLLRSEMQQAPITPAHAQAAYPTTATESPTASAADGSHTTHVNVQRQTDERDTENTVDSEDPRKAGLNQLWQAYRSASKVA